MVTSCRILEKGDSVRINLPQPILPLVSSTPLFSVFCKVFVPDFGLLPNFDPLCGVIILIYAKRMMQVSFSSLRSDAIFG